MLELHIGRPHVVTALSISGEAVTIRDVAIASGRLALLGRDSIVIGSATVRHLNGRRSGPYRTIVADSTCTVRLPSAFGESWQERMLLGFAVLFILAMRGLRQLDR
jgi:hypothetical protein